MGLIVHGRASSSNVQAVMWGAAELSLQVERRDVGGPYGGTDTPAYRAMNPMGFVPTLEDGEARLFESAAILRYLLQRYPSPDFDTSPEADMWAEWGKHTLGAAFTEPVFWTFYRTPEAERDMEVVVRNLRRFETRLAVAMTMRGSGPWMLGPCISLADIWVGHVLYRYFALDLPRNASPGAQAYYDMLCARPGYRQHVMVDYSELKGRLTF